MPRKKDHLVQQRYYIYVCVVSVYVYISWEKANCFTSSSTATSSFMVFDTTEIIGMKYSFDFFFLIFNLCIYVYRHSTYLGDMGKSQLKMKLQLFWNLPVMYFLNCGHQGIKQYICPIISASYCMWKAVIGLCSSVISFISQLV